MKRHVKVYLFENGYTKADVDLVPCEIRAASCHGMSVDICHIEHKGMGGQPSRDVNENLIAGCRNCHEAIDGANSPLTKDELKQIAERRIDANHRN